jgi:hypothetical protein
VSVRATPVNVSPVSVEVEVEVIVPLLAFTSVSVVISGVIVPVTGSAKSIPRAELAGPVAPDVLAAETHENAESVNTKVISLTSCMSAWFVALPERVSVATVFDVRVTVAVRPAGTPQRVTLAPAVSVGAKVAPESVAIIEPLTIPVFEAVSLNPVPE